MIRFSDEAWERTRRLREAIHGLPFNTELAAGSLTRERFRGYILQDALYLGRFSRALAIAAAKAPDSDAMQSFAQSALRAVAVEQALHGQYLREFGIDPARIGEAETSPDCLAYTSYLIAAAYHEPWEVLVAALLPCFRIYWDVGCAIAQRAALENPYRAWIDTYADERFGKARWRPLSPLAIAPPSRSPRLRERRCSRPSSAPANTSGCSGTAPTGVAAGPPSTNGSS